MSLAETAGRLLETVRTRRPRVHCVTNDAAKVLTANMLLALGAEPSLTTARDEIAGFVAGSDALLINLGTPDNERMAAVSAAVAAAGECGLPWLLDPVFADRSSARAAAALELLGKRPTILRANAREFDHLLAGVKADSPGTFASVHAVTAVRSGAHDLITDGKRQATVENGDALMGRVTAMGCAGTAVVAAFAAVERDAWVAAASGMLVMGLAGELAAREAHGPGSFAAGVLDRLYTLDAGTLERLARIG